MVGDASGGRRPGVWVCAKVGDADYASTWTSVRGPRLSGGDPKSLSFGVARKPSIRFAIAQPFMGLIEIVFRISRSSVPWTRSVGLPKGRAAKLAVIQRRDRVSRTSGLRYLRQIGAFIEDDDETVGSTHRLVACGKVNRQIVVVLEKFTVYRELLDGTGCNAVVRNQPGLRSGTWQFCDRLTVEQGRILRTAPPLRVQGIGLHGGESLGLWATEHQRIVDRKAVSKPRCGGKTDGHVPDIRPRYRVHDEVQGMEATTLEGSDKKHVAGQPCSPPGM